jgi:hypothetical protein
LGLLLISLLLPLAAEGPAVRAATVVTQDSTVPRWRVVTAPVDSAPRATITKESTAPRWRVVTAPEDTAPRSALISTQEAVPPRVVAGSTQSDATLPADAAVAAAPIRPPYVIRPSLGGGMPTGFVSGWGDYFLSASAGTPGNLRAGVVDGSVNMGFGLGDPEKLLGLELYWGIGSTKNLNANGSFGASLGRLLVNRSDLQVAVAGGVIDAFPYGYEPNPQPLNGYGAVSVALPLRPADPTFTQVVQFTVGGGGSSFAAIDSSYQLTEAGAFGAVGVELLANLGFSVGVSTRSTNVNLSWVPFRTLPVFVNLLAADVFGSTPWGTVGVLTVGWGDNLQNGFASR